MAAERRRFNEALGRKIQGARQASGMKAVDLARAIGASGVTICRYESGERECPLGALRRIAEALKIEPGALLPRFTSVEKSAAAPLKSTPVGANCLNGNFAGVARKPC